MLEQLNQPKWEPVDRAQPIVLAAPKKVAPKKSKHTVHIVLPDPQIGYRNLDGRWDPFHDEHAMDVDPDNALLWRFHRRRLEAEAVRDAVLAVSGRLNPEIYGLPIFPPLPDGIEERVKYSENKWATDTGPQSRKRSLYIYQQRTLTMPFMQTFDGLVCEDTMPRRQTSVTPLQALAMYNGDLVNEEALHFAERLKQHSADPRERIEYAFAIALGRPPASEEVAELQEYASTDAALPGLCRILYNANEFVYVD